MTTPAQMARQEFYKMLTALKTSFIDLKQNKPMAHAFLEEMLGHGPQLADWPVKMATALLSPSVKHSDRIQLTLFVLQNRYPPDLFVRYLLARGSLSDRAARDDIKWFITEHMAGKLASKYSALMIGATQNKPIHERKHKWDGVGDPVTDEHGRLKPVSLPVESPHWEEHSPSWSNHIEAVKLLSLELYHNPASDNPWGLSGFKRLRFA